MLEILAKWGCTANSTLFLLAECRGMRKAVIQGEGSRGGGICVVALLDALKQCN